MKDIRQIPLIDQYIEEGVKFKAGKLALIQYESGKQLIYKQLGKYVKYYSLRLIASGIQKGERVAFVGSLCPEMICLMLATIKIGAIFVPLCKSSRPREILEELTIAKPTIIVFSDEAIHSEFVRAGNAGGKKANHIKSIWFFSYDSEKVLPGTQSFLKVMDPRGMTHLRFKNRVLKNLEKRQKGIHPWQPVLLFFKRGLRGEKRPVLLCHENIISQLQMLSRGTGLKSSTKVLANMKANEMGAVVHGVLLTLMAGGTSLLMRNANAADTLFAIESYQIHRVYQAPETFLTFWQHPGFLTRDLSSLEIGITISEEEIPLSFFNQMGVMFPSIGGGFFFPEASGFVSLWTQTSDLLELAVPSGKLFSEIGPISIRESMMLDGKAGVELPLTIEGEVCCHAPYAFSGYYGQEKLTAKAISKEGILYTGRKGRIMKVKDSLLLMESPQVFVEHYASKEGFSTLD